MNAINENNLCICVGYRTFCRMHLSNQLGSMSFDSTRPLTLPVNNSNRRLWTRDRARARAHTQ